MRVIAGKYGGRMLVRPKTELTRPMSDKVREALFNLIGPMEGWQVLDAYAGSGAVAIEALSRGAAHAVAVDSAREPLQAINKSRETLGIGPELTIVAMTVKKAITKLAQNRFDLIVADPPYENLDTDELSKLALLLTSSGTLVVSHSSRISPPQVESMERFDTRTYGDSSLSFYRRLKSE